MFDQSRGDRQTLPVIEADAMAWQQSYQVKQSVDCSGNWTVKKFWRVVGSEILVGAVLGILFGVALGAMGFFRFRGNSVADPFLLAVAVGSASAVAMVLAATVAAAIPMLFARLHIDPAVATGPFVTTAVDIIGVIVYFNIVTAIV